MSIESFLAIHYCVNFTAVSPALLLFTCQPDLPLSGDWCPLPAGQAPSHSLCGQHRRRPWGAWCHAGGRRHTWAVRPPWHQRGTRRRGCQGQLLPGHGWAEHNSFHSKENCLMSNLIMQTMQEKAKGQTAEAGVFNLNIHLLPLPSETQSKWAMATVFWGISNGMALFYDSYEMIPEPKHHY